MTRLAAIQQRLDACSVGTVRERGEAEMEFHRHAMADVECLLRIAQAAETLLSALACDEDATYFARDALREALAALDDPKGAT